MGISIEAKRSDCPEIYLQRDSPEQRVGDLEQVLSYVRKQYNYRKIVVLGGSEGAVIANMLSSRADYIDATIAFNGGGRWFIDDILDGMQYVSSNPDEIKTYIYGFNQFAKHILTSEPFELSMSNHGYTWWRGSLPIDQQAILCAIKSPVLIVQGGKDRAVSPIRTTEMIGELRNLGKNNIEYFFYGELDHSFKEQGGQNNTGKVIDDMNAWLKKKIGKIPNPAVKRDTK